jgi:hypothetical protein
MTRIEEEPRITLVVFEDFSPDSASTLQIQYVELDGSAVNVNSNVSYLG